MAATSALHSFFASSFPIPILHDNDAAIVCRIVEDNAKGLVTQSSASETRRLKDARRIKIQQLYKSRSSSRPGVPRSSSTKLSRWESEVPDLASLTASPPAPTRRRSLGSVDPKPGAVAPNSVCAPKTPKRRASTRSEESKRSSGKQGQAPVVPQQLSTNLPSLLKTNIEANTSPATIEDDVPQQRIHPAQSSQARNTLSMKSSSGRVSPLHESLDTFLKRKSSLKNAPRPPRRMKSMELTAEDGDTVSISVSEDDSLRYSVHPLLGHKQQDTNPAKLPPVEQIALKDSIKGVVVSLAQQQKQSRRSSIVKSNYHQDKPMLDMNTMLNL